MTRTARPPAPASSPLPSPAPAPGSADDAAAAAVAARWRRFRVRVFAACWLSYVGFYFCRNAFYVVKSELTVERGLSPTTLGAIGTAYLVAYSVGEFNAAAVGSRIGARRMLLGGMALSLFANVVFGFANNVYTFGAFMVLNGLAQATGWPGNLGTMAHWFRRSERGRVMGFWSSCYQVGGVLSKSFAAFMLGLAGWRWSFWAASLVLGGVWLVFYLLQRERPEDVGLPPIDDDHHGAAKPASTTPANTTPANTTTSATTTPATTAPPAKAAAGGAPAPGSFAAHFDRRLLTNILLVGGFYFFVKFIRYALWSWAPYFLRLNFGLSKSHAGYVSTLLDLAGLAGAITAGWLSDRHFAGRRTGVALLFLIGLTLSALGLWSLGAHSLGAFCVFYVLVGFTLYGPDSLLTGAGAIDMGSRRFALVAAGLINGIGSIGSVVQESVIGNLYQRDPTHLAPVLVTLLLSATGATTFVAWLLWRARRGLCDI